MAIGATTQNAIEVRLGPEDRAVLEARLRGEFKFICGAGGMDCGYRRRGANFDWLGFDEMNEASGSGDADLGEDDVLTIEFKFFMRDEAILKARRW